MFKSAHCLRTESLSFFRMKLGDGTSRSAKAVLKKVSLQCQLTDRLQHLVVLLFQCCLLSLCFFDSLDRSTKTLLAFSRNSFFQLRTILGFRLFSAAISPNSRSPCNTSRTILTLNSGVYVFRAMVYASFPVLFYHTMFTIFSVSVVRFSEAIIENFIIRKANRA